jgi:hypothetical protein
VQVPDVLEDGAAGHRLAGVAHQVAQQLALHLRQPVRRLLDANLHRREVDRPPAKGEAVGASRRRALLDPPPPPQQPVDARQQNRQLERLG